MLTSSGKCRFRFRGRLVPFLLSLLFIPVNALAAPSSPSPTVLKTDSTVSFEMKADDRFEFLLPAAEGQAYLLQIDQGGLDLKIALQMNGSDQRVFDFPTGRDDIELLLLEPWQGDPPLVSIYSEEFTGIVANPRIGITPVETGDALLPAYRLLTAAARAYGGSEWEKALALLEQVTPVLEGPETTALYARTQFGMAILFGWNAFDYEPGVEAAKRAEAAYRSIGDESLAASALHLGASFMIEQAGSIEKTPSKGVAPEAQALFDRSIGLQEQALETQRRLGNRFRTAFILNMIGYTYYSMGDYERALAFYEPAAELFGALDEWEYQVWPLQNMGVIDFDRGYLVRATDALSRSLAILPPGRADGVRQFLFNNLGGIHLSLGELDQALKFFSSALELHEQTGELPEQGFAIKGIGLTYIAYGETELGMEYLERALPIQREAKSYRGVVSTLNEMGTQYLENGDIEAAIAAHREAERTAVMARDRTNAQIRLVGDLIAAGEPEQALEILASAMQAAGDVESESQRAELLKLYGDTWLSQSRYADALDSYREANAVYEQLGLSIERSQVLYGMSRSFAGLSDTENAVQHAIRAIESVENHRASLSTPQLRAFFMARRQDYYAHLVGTLVDLQEQASTGETSQLERALGYSERGHARSLVDLINEAAQVRGENDANEERDALHTELADVRYRLLGNANMQQSVAEKESNRQRLADIENRLNLLEIRLRETNPEYANLVDPAVLDARGIQDMLDAESALLQYVLGSQRSFVFLVMPDSLQAWTLPGRDELENQAREIYEGLKTPSSSRAEREELSKQLDSFSRSILPPPGVLRQNRLLVVADGVLQYLPFSVLLAANDNGETRTPLSGHEVVNVPSMSVLAVQRSNQANREVPEKTIAIFADPVFSNRDQRIAGSSGNLQDNGAEPASRQPANLAQPGDLQRLPATAFEADTIAGLLDPSETAVYTGFDASRETVLESDLARYRIVHFATHGKIDSRYPALSWLAFSQVQPQGVEQNGLVRLHDIYNLDLNADLVTMSACDTALGRQIRGEGLTGLVQGFMYSGARSVLASLWQVPDRATAELMGQFYRNLLEDGQDPPGALRNAQLQLASRARWRHPYYWSAFVLQGDWN